MKSVAAFPLLLACLSVTSCAAFFGEPYVPSEENLEAREWFRDATFGIEFDWGLPEGATLEERAQLFNPVIYRPEAWVELAKAAGAQYIVAPARGSDALALWDTRTTDWDVVEQTPHTRDVIAPLAEAARAAEMPLILSYSIADERLAGASKTEHARARREIENQIEELLKNYEGIAGVWLEGYNDENRPDLRLNELYRAIHRQDSSVLIATDAGEEMRGEDVLAFERVPDERVESALPTEMRISINKHDGGVKSAEDLLHSLIRSAGIGANLLLRVTPTPDGAIPTGQRAVLEQMGRWLSQHTESIYETRAGAIAPAEWGVSTQKQNKIYIHYLLDRGGTLVFPVSIGSVRSAYNFDHGAAMDLSVREGENVLEIPTREIDPIDTILVLEVDPPPVEE